MTFYLKSVLKAHICCIIALAANVCCYAKIDFVCYRHVYRLLYDKISDFRKCGLGSIHATSGWGNFI